MMVCEGGDESSCQFSCLCFKLEFTIQKQRMWKPPIIESSLRTRAAECVTGHSGSVFTGPAGQALPNRAMVLISRRSNLKLRHQWPSQLQVCTHIRFEVFSTLCLSKWFVIDTSECLIRSENSALSTYVPDKITNCSFQAITQDCKASLTGAESWSQVQQDKSSTLPSWTLTYCPCLAALDS